jgi:hypothetical protein
MEDRQWMGRRLSHGWMTSRVGGGGGKEECEKGEGYTTTQGGEDEVTRNRRHYLKCKISTEARYIEIKHPCMLLDFLIPTKDKSCLLNHENLQVSLSALESKLYAIRGLNLAFSFPRL